MGPESCKFCCSGKSAIWSLIRSVWCAAHPELRNLKEMLPTYCQFIFSLVLQLATLEGEKCLKDVRTNSINGISDMLREYRSYLLRLKMCSSCPDQSYLNLRLKSIFAVLEYLKTAHLHLFSVTDISYSVGYLENMKATIISHWSLFRISSQFAWSSRSSRDISRNMQGRQMCQGDSHLSFPFNFLRSFWHWYFDVFGPQEHAFLTFFGTPFPLGSIEFEILISFRLLVRKNRHDS